MLIHLPHILSLDIFALKYNLNDKKFFAVSKIINNDISSSHYITSTGGSTRVDIRGTLLAEREQVLKQEFPLIFNDYNNINQQKLLVQELKMNRILKLFRKFGFVKIIDKL